MSEHFRQPSSHSSGEVSSFVPFLRTWTLDLDTSSVSGQGWSALNEQTVPPGTSAEDGFEFHFRAGLGPFSPSKETHPKESSRGHPS